MAPFDVCRDAALLPKLKDKRTLLGHRRSVEIDPERHFAASFAATQREQWAAIPILDQLLDHLVGGGKHT